MAPVAVFLSYSSQDEALAAELPDELGAEHEVWIDSADGRSGAVHARVR